MVSRDCTACGGALQSTSVGLVSCRGCRATYVSQSAARVTLLTSIAGGEDVTGPLLELDTEFRERFELGRVLGHGAMGMVCEGLDRTLGRRMAVKLLLKPGNEDVLRRFRLEGKILERLVHPNVITVHEVGDIRGNPYLCMELLPGGTLRDRLKVHGQLPAGRAVEIVGALLDGLHECHLAGIVHRDLKPENVLFTSDGTPKIADFGIAKTFDDSTHVTQVGALIGTPFYMAPEQLRGESASVASDLYAVGLMLYETLAGKPPIAFSTLANLFTERLERDPVPLHDVAHVPPGVSEWVMRALRRPMGERPQSAADLAAGLRRVVGLRDPAGSDRAPASARAEPAPARMARNQAALARRAPAAPVASPRTVRGIPVLLHSDYRFGGLIPYTAGMYAFILVFVSAGQGSWLDAGVALALFVGVSIFCALTYPRKP